MKFGKYEVDVSQIGTGIEVTNRLVTSLTSTKQGLASAKDNLGVRLGDVYDNGVFRAPTNADILEIATVTVQEYIDYEAQAFGFDDINSISKFRGFDNKYVTDADNLAVWQAQVWEATELSEATTLEGLMLSLPKRLSDV